jgi:serine/threonine protein kinase
MNNTIDTIVDPINLEFWIYTVLDYLAYLHRNLLIVNLDIKPQNIFLGRRD